jgi:hypothetical protein
MRKYLGIPLTMLLVGLLCMVLLSAFKSGAPYTLPTVTVATGGTGLSNPTAHDIFIAEGSSAFGLLNLGADTFLQGEGASTDPQGGSIPNCAGALQYSTSTHNMTCASPLGTAAGGTGTAAPAMTMGNGMSQSGTWPNVTLTNSDDAYFSSAILSLAHGGTAQSAPAMTMGNGMSQSGTWPNVTLTNSDDAYFSSGILSLAHGGTAQSAPAMTMGNGMSQSGTWPNVTLTNSDDAYFASAILAPAHGGTGLASPTAHDLMFGEGTSAFNVLSMGADTLLQGQGSSTDPAAVSVPNAPNGLAYSTTTHAFSAVGASSANQWHTFQVFATSSLATGTYYYYIDGSSDATVTNSEGSSESPLPIATTFSLLTCRTSFGEGASSTLQITLRDGGTGESVTCTIPNSGSTCSDNTHSFSASAGDLVDWQAIFSGQGMSTNQQLLCGYKTVS